MYCFNCGCLLSEKDFCTGCGADVVLYKKIMHAANHLYNDALEKAKVRDLTGAISSLRRCLKLDRCHIDARNLLGLVYFERGEVVSALSQWIISKNTRSEKNIANDYINMIQNNPGRLESYNQTIRKYNMALTYCQQDSLDLAVIQLRKVISLNPRFVQARQLLALLYLNSQEWEKAKKELNQILSIDVNNTTTLKYLKEVDAMMPAEEENARKKKDAIVYKSGNDTVIQPVGKKDRSALQTLVNMLVGVLIGAGIAWFLVLPARIQQAQEDVNERYKAVSEQLDAKTVQVNELTIQVDELTQEKDSLSSSLSAAQADKIQIQANTELIEAVLMYMNKTGDEMAVADALERIDGEYMENEATESFKALYEALKDNVGKVVARKCYDLGYAAFRAEEYDTAIENLARAYSYDATNGEALYNLGNSYNKKGDLDKAVEIYEQVIELFPNTEKARRSQNYIKEIKGD
ncbi:MAG: tetratricopeptide repeat protein [Lachnospiraceae bacterium]|nr:tetratricopeptide repeat protein [Lachnospiraceae bacterium]